MSPTNLKNLKVISCNGNDAERPIPFALDYELNQKNLLQSKK